MSNKPSRLSEKRLKRMTMRQRKKLRVGEFSELGCSILASLADNLDAQAQDQLLEAWLSKIEQLGISFGGQFNAQEALLEGIIFPVGNHLVTEAVRSDLLQWLGARQEVVNAEVSERFDIWHAA